MAMAITYCVKEQKSCVLWVKKYFKDCLCNLKDEVSFGFGLISLLFWGVAEIPQIITNFRSKSSHGVSLIFLLAWVSGDVLNLVGCLLEPATLPTQFYAAMLYTTSTVVLLLQGLYYNHNYRWWKCERDNASQLVEDDDKNPLKKPKLADSAIPIPNASHTATSRREYYYTSARSIASSGPPAVGLDNESSSEYEGAPRPTPRSAGYGTFLAASLNLPLQSKALKDAYVGITSRRHLHEGSGVVQHSALGQWLGWFMAAIYMGGRIPQIWLNIKRGNVEGLNPLTFIFSLVANLTYVLSIIVRSTEWDSIKANLAWLVDAAACVALDLFIMFQYIYYRYIHQ